MTSGSVYVMWYIHILDKMSDACNQFLYILYIDDL